MNRLRLFLLLRKQNSLALRRNPAFDQNVVAKVMMYLGAGMMTIYLIFLGTMLAMPASEARMFTMVLAMSPLWLAIDFGSRFAVQQTPAMMVKPYLLQPMPFHSVIETFLVNTLLAGYNWVWLALYLPYAFIVLCGGASFATALLIILCGILLTLANSQFYLIVRTLTARFILWWVLPILVYGGFWLPVAINEKWMDKQIDFLCDFTSTWYFFLFCAVLLSGLFMLNRWMQFRYVREEIMKGYPFTCHHESGADYRPDITHLLYIYL